jgi:hypothetical protein
MFEILDVLIFILVGALLFAGGVFTGGWMAFKFKNAVQGENFLGGVPKGEVFTMKDEIDALMDGEQAGNEAEKGVLARTEKFLKTLAGGNS